MNMSRFDGKYCTRSSSGPKITAKTGSLNYCACNYFRSFAIIYLIEFFRHIFSPYVLATSICWSKDNYLIIIHHCFGFVLHHSSACVALLFIIAPSFLIFISIFDIPYFKSAKQYQQMHHCLVYPIICCFKITKKKSKRKR